MDHALLCGGTALARCYLKHRVSYDLDFFVPERFEPEILMARLSKAGISLAAPEIRNEVGIAVQVHAYTKVKDTEIKLSFVEDVYAGMFPERDCHFGDTRIRTEELDGLMHRKLRTISGAGLDVSGVPMGGRHTARDMFDLYVLDRKHRGIDEFIRAINAHGANFPVEAYEVGVRSIPWVELLDELNDIEVLEPYSVDQRAIRETLEASLGGLDQ